MDTPPQTSGMPYGHLEDLLKESVELGRENNRLLKRMYRNSIIGAILKIIIWLLVLGVPIFFLSSYLTPLMQAFQSETGTTTVPGGVFGLPSAAQLQQIVNEYRAQQGQK